MARKISRRIKTLRGFVAWAEQFTDGKYLFRGVSKQSYKLRVFHKSLNVAVTGAAVRLCLPTK